MDDAGRAFIQEARSRLVADYMPKIERSVERLTDEQIWWRAAESSNSVGNLLLHLEGNLRQWVVCGVGGERRARRLRFGRALKLWALKNISRRGR